MADIFLSYSSKDAAAAGKIRDALAARGYDVFWDQATPAGQDWDSWIREKLQASKVAVVLWSNTSVKSPNVRHEAMIALGHKKIVPAMIDTLAPEDFPMGLYVVQAVNLIGWRDPNAGGYQRLIDEVEARLGKRATAPGKQAPAPVSRPSSPMPLIIGALAVAILGAGGWYVMQRKPAEPVDATGAIDVSRIPPNTVGPLACPGGAPPVVGVCPDSNGLPGAPVLGSPPEGEFSKRMVGRWRFNDTQPCKDGPNVTWESRLLVFTTPDSRFVHEIETDAPLVTSTHVLDPPSEAGEKYKLSPEFFATSSERSFNLVVENTTTGTRDVWTPCEIQ